ncbi:hypothetical protein WMY93_003579 [Mugilogobius chulae]|uniref:Interferon-induced protein 44-like n=1 Tax=Mugilogobius chulae TaxID=88201 RepID=A0AAW0PX35_9GOBI
MAAFKWLKTSASAPPWRIVPSDDRNSLLDYIKKFRLTKDEVQHIRIMVYVETIIRGRLTCQASPDSVSGSSFTTKYQTHTIKKDSSTCYPFVFIDVMGLEKDRKKGASPEDIVLALKGHMKDGYEFKPDTPMSPSDPYFNSSPTLNDKTHILVCVVPANTSNLLSTEHTEKIREVRCAARDLGIPQMAILTKIDEACPEVNSKRKDVYTNVRTVYKTPQIPSTPFSKAEKDDYLEYINDYQPDQKDVEHLRILLYGPNNAGKSSFINSVETTLRGRMTGQALAGVGHDSFTVKYQTHKIQKDRPGSFYPFVFNDIMGLEKDESKGICVDDIKLAMKGHVKDGYVFNSQSAFTSENQHYNKSPTINDQIHVLVCVVSAGTLTIMSDGLISKMRQVRLAARDLGIPQMAILTKIDEACLEVQSDIENVYRSKFVKDLMEKLSASLGIPLNCIFPVKNYHYEICKEDGIEKLILMALKQMLDFGEDFVNNCDKTSSSE